MENLLSQRRRASLCTSRSQEGSLKGPSSQDVLMEVRPALPSRPDQATPEPVPMRRNSTCERQKERFHRAQKSYQCEKCPKIFRYFSQLKVHQRRHNNERKFICATCDRGCFQTSANSCRREAFFGRSTCAKFFDHGTDILAHERIHMGEKRYVCSVCQICYRHLRTHLRTAFRCVSSTPEAAALMKCI